MTMIDPNPQVSAHDDGANWLRLTECTLAEETQAALSLRAKRHGFEVCGFIVGDNEIVPVKNTHETPKKNFRIDTAENEKYSASITGIFHSHPSGFEGPTKADEEGMKVLYRAGCPWRYFIVTADDVIEYRWIG